MTVHPHDNHIERSLSNLHDTQDNAAQEEDSLFRTHLSEHVNSLHADWTTIKRILDANPELYVDKCSQSKLWHLAISEDNDEVVRAMMIKNPLAAFHKLSCPSCIEVDGHKDGSVALRCAVVHDAFACADAMLQLYKKILSTPYPDPASDDPFDGSDYVHLIDISHITLMLKHERYVIDTLDMLVGLIKWPQDVRRVVDGDFARNRVTMNTKGLLAGSEDMCPENFWTKEKGISESYTGVNLDAFVVPLKGAASLRPAFLLSLVGAVKTCKSHKNDIFGNEVVELIVNFKWTTFVRRIYYRDATIHFVWTVVFLTNTVFFTKTYMNHTSLPHTIAAVTLFSAQTCIYVHFIKHELLDFLTTMTDFHDVRGFWMAMYRYCFNMWNLLDVIILTTVASSTLTQFFSFALTSHIPTCDWMELVRYFRVSSSLALPFLSMKILFYLQGDHHTAAIIRMIKKISQSTVIFAFILLIICMGFAGSFTLLFEKHMFAAGEFDEYSTYDRALVSVFATMFGDFDLQSLYSCYSPQTAVLLLFFFLTFVGLILLNLLIAIMGDQYQQVNDNKKAQAVYGRALIVAEYERVKTFSPANELAWFPTWIQNVQPRSTFDRLMKSKSDRNNLFCRDKSKENRREMMMGEEREEANPI
jgi:hypothetical protein